MSRATVRAAAWHGPGVGPVNDPYSQHGFDARLEWGPNGLRRLAPVCDVIVIVDVLSFTTAVDIALGRGAEVFPYRWQDGKEAASDLPRRLADCSSGRELAAAGFAAETALAAELDASPVAPCLEGEAFRYHPRS